MAALLKLWEVATPLCDAWRKFADRPDPVKMELPEGPQGVGSIPELIGGVVSLFGLRSSWILHMRDKLISRIASREFVAVGYRKHPNSRDRIEWISAEHFSTGHVSWDDSKFSFRDQAYDNVRVIAAKAVPESLRSKLKGNASARIGRPGTSEFIQSAILELRRTDASFCALKRKVAAELVRREIRRTNGDEFDMRVGYSDKTIERAIFRACSCK